MKQSQISFEEHKRVTAEDCETLAKSILELAEKVKAGDMKSFEQFWITGGTEEGDAKIYQLIEMIVMRYLHREERKK